MTSQNFNPNELPNWAYKFFCWYCDPLKFENVHGDLEELFNYEKKTLRPRPVPNRCNVCGEFIKIPLHAPVKTKHCECVSNK